MFQNKTKYSQQEKIMGLGPKYGKGRKFYTYAEFLNKYEAWRSLPELKRDREWNAYCDIRDGHPRGYTQIMEDELKKSDLENKLITGVQ